MTGTTRFELSPENGRGNYSSAGLDRSGSFREGVENRILHSGPGSARATAPLSVETPPSQFLNLGQIVTADQKFTRSGELRRAVGVSLASTAEDHSFAASHLKPSPPIAAEELKRFRASVLDTSNKTRDRSKKLTESISKLDKYVKVLQPKKRRTESSGGTGILKMGNHLHQSLSDIVSPKIDDKNKNVVLNKRVRTAFVDPEGRNTALLRQPVVMDKDKDMLRACNGSSFPVEEKVRGLPLSGEGWDKKMKRKRSVATVATRAMDGEREAKRTMNQKLSNEARPQSYIASGFGSGHTNGITGMTKLENTSQANPSNGRMTSRNELDNAPFPTDRRERGAVVDKERVLPKGNRASAREDIQGGSPTPVTKGKVARAPRTGSGVPISSPSFSRTPGALDAWEQPSCVNKFQSVGGPNNRKRPISTGSSSAPMAQWIGQRQQKSSRTRRSNLVSPVLNRDEAQISSEGFCGPEFSGRSTPDEASGSLVLSGTTTNTQHLKMKFENVPSPARLSESEESGAGDVKLKEKGTDNDGTVDRSINTMQKVGSVMMPMKKNKMFVKDDIGYGVRRQGRSGRGSSVARAGIPKEKLDNTFTTKPPQSMKPGSVKNESKSGRPLSKKVADRKGFSRPGHVLNSGSSDMTGDSDDDREELLAAASAVHDVSHLACSGSFWKKMEPIFGLVSLEDTTCIKRQLSFAEELDESLHDMFGADFSIMGDLVDNEAMSSPSIVSRDSQGIYLDGVETEGRVGNLSSIDHFLESNLSGKLNGEQDCREVPPLYQRILSALISEDDFEELEHNSEIDHLDDEDHHVDSEIDSEIDYRVQKHYVFDSFSCDGSTASDSFRSSSVSNPPYGDELWHRDYRIVGFEAGLASGFVKNQSQPVDKSHGGIHSFGQSYEQMSLNERLVLELQSIGLLPEAVPDLTEGEEEEEINKDISALQEELYQQVGKKKEYLRKIDKAIQKGREFEERKLEQTAMDKLVEMAYRRRMACRGSNATKSGVSRVSKQAALAFAKRTIAREQKFRDTGKSCFSEPALRGIIFSACNNAAELLDVGGSGGNTRVQVHNSQPESRASGVGIISTSVEKQVSSDTFETIIHSCEQDFARQEFGSNRGRKKEVLLGDVAGISPSRASPALGSSLTGGAKGKRSERDRDQNKLAAARNSVAKAGRPAVGGFRGERRTKTKPKQKTAQLSTSGNGLLGRVSETPNSLEKINAASSRSSREGDSSKDTEKAVDFSNLPMSEIDSIEEFGDDSFFNFDVDGLQDHDSMGLEIPMDDLAGVVLL